MSAVSRALELRRLVDEHAALRMLRMTSLPVAAAVLAEHLTSTTRLPVEDLHELIDADLDRLREHFDLSQTGKFYWVPEPAPSTATLEHLTEAERQALHALRDEGSVRLEQERIPWNFALEALRAAVDETVDASSAVLKASAPQTL